MNGLTKNEYKKIIEANNSGILKINMDGKIKFLNRNASKLLGISEKELIGGNFFDFIEEENILLSENDIPKKIKITNELTKERILSLKVKLLKTRKIIIIEDITNREKIEKALEEAKKRAEESDRLKSAFLANVGHEIRTPLNGILGFVDILEDQVKDSQQQEEIQIIKESGKVLLNLMNAIIEISKIEAGLQDIKSSKFELGRVIKNIFEIYSKNRENIELNLDIPTDKELYITTDKYKLEQVIYNLVSNAFKFTEDGYIRVGYETTEEKIRIFVEDSGIGIPAQELGNIFDRFRQADMSFTRKFEGVGLGLSIVKELLDLLGGTIEVESVENEGTRFTIIFYKTVLMEEVSDIEMKIEEDIKLKDKKVLVVEDNRINYLYVKHRLEDKDMKVVSAKNGNEGVSLAKSKEDIDIILMDIQLPGIDGITAMKQIKEFNKKVPIVATTAFSFKGDKERLLAEGFDGYMAKPIKKENLYDVIMKLLKLD